MAGIKLKSEDDLKLMRPACVIAGQVLDEIAAFIRPGFQFIATSDPNSLAAYSPAYSQQTGTYQPTATGVGTLVIVTLVGVAVQVVVAVFPPVPVTVSV